MQALSMSFSMCIQNVSRQWCSDADGPVNTVHQSQWVGRKSSISVTSLTGIADEDIRLHGVSVGHEPRHGHHRVHAQGSA